MSQFAWPQVAKSRLTVSANSRNLRKSPTTDAIVLKVEAVFAGCDACDVRLKKDIVRAAR